MNRLTDKIKEISVSVLPIIILVLFLHFTLTPLAGTALTQFLLGALCIIFGLSLFLVGVDIAITPIGEYLGQGMVLSNSYWVVSGLGFLLGFIIAYAEPSLVVIANQISMVTGGSIPSQMILVTVSAGVGLVIAIGSLKIVTSFPIKKLVMLLYLVMFVAMIFTSNGFISISFDASAAVTGAIAVPFIMAIGTGIADLKKHPNEADNFGLTGLVPVGAAIAVMILSIVTGQGEISGSLEIDTSGPDNILSYFFSTLSNQLTDVASSVLPVAIVFLIYQVWKLKLNTYALRRILVGLIYVFIGLLIYLTGVNAGFMDVGTLLGYALADRSSYLPLLVISFILGAVTILAEPAVTVQTQMIEDVTGGAIKGGPIKGFLSAGAGIAILIAVIRILIPSMELWHIVVPGYLLVLFMTTRVSDLFVGMAFDAGSVASGPMAATFILAFVQGAAEAVPHADVLLDGFGMIGLVLMVPIIAILFFGYYYEKNATEAN